LKCLKPALVQYDLKIFGQRHLLISVYGIYRASNQVWARVKSLSKTASQKRTMLVERPQAFNKSTGKGEKIWEAKEEEGWGRFFIVLNFKHFRHFKL
jgi:hypothetical protein